MQIRLFISAAFIFAAEILVAQNDYGSYHSRQMSDLQEYIDSQQKQVQAYTDDIMSDYDAYVAKVHKEYNDYVKSIEEQWGDGNAAMSDRTNWVEYDNDGKSRTSVNFESGKAEVEIIVSDNELTDKSLVNKRLEESVENLLNSKGKTVEYSSEYIPQKQLSDKAIMDDLIETKQYSGTTSSKEVAKAIVKSEPITVKRVDSDRGKVNIVTITPAMVGDHIYKLAKRYEPMVIAASKRFGIDKSLIFAIIETESYFNPAAVSHVPAYGLMQIVPKYAGRDTYKHIYGEDKILSQDYLFQPDKNIEIGTGFLQILATKYFRNVNDKKSRELCMIAAYNTGPGNVSRAMAGHTNIFKTIPQINEMSYNSLYNYFSRKLPYSETKDYIQKVTTRREKYREL